MKSQKLKPEQIKAGDRIIIISKSGDTRAIVTVYHINSDYLYTELNSYPIKAFDFYICPPAFTIVPNMYVPAKKEPVVILNTIPDIHGDGWYAYMIGQNLTISFDKQYNIIPIPDEPIYKEITIAEIEAKFGCKVKIMENKR